MTATTRALPSRISAVVGPQGHAHVERGEAFLDCPVQGGRESRPGFLRPGKLAVAGNTRALQGSALPLCRGFLQQPEVVPQVQPAGLVDPEQRQLLGLGNFSRAREDNG